MFIFSVTEAVGGRGTHWLIETIWTMQNPAEGLSQQRRAGVTIYAEQSVDAAITAVWDSIVKAQILWTTDEKHD